MTYFLTTCVGLPAVTVGAMFQDGPLVVLGLLALGMAAVGAAGLIVRHEFRLYRHHHQVAHHPLGQLRIGSHQGIEDQPKDRAA